MKCYYKILLLLKLNNIIDERSSFRLFSAWRYTYIGKVTIIVLSVWGGIRFARWRKTQIGHEDDTPINTLVGATLGLLAFILAFTFGLTSSRFDARKHFLLEEVNSIETSWLRAGLIREPYSTEIKKSLVEYVEIRLWLVENPDEVKKALQQSGIIQNNIWSQITSLVNEDVGNDKINALLIEAVNGMFDNQTRRVAKGLIDRIPGLIWVALFALIIIAMFEVGYLLGKTEKSNRVLVLALALAFSAVIIIIVDLDSSKGTISLNNQAVFDLHSRLIGN